MRKYIALLLLLLTCFTLFAACGNDDGPLPTDAEKLITKMNNKKYSVSTTRDEDIPVYMEEYGSAEGDVLVIVHADKKRTTDTLFYLGNFFYCKDEATAIALKDIFLATEGENYINFTAEQKGCVAFFGTKQVWDSAN